MKCESVFFFLQDREEWTAIDKLLGNIWKESANQAFNQGLISEEIKHKYYQSGTHCIKPTSHYQIITGRRVHSRWFNWMKFTLIVLAQLFWSNCPTVGPNFSVAVKNSPRLSDRVWHVRQLLITFDYYPTPPPLQVLTLALFYIWFSTIPSDPLIRGVMGRWHKSYIFFNDRLLKCMFT